jgi:DNA ligase D-like protein (predicted ligase)
MKQYGKVEGGYKLGSFVSPMLATLSEDPAFDDPKWIFEIKWDGYRAVAELKGADTRLYSRNGLSFSKAYPKIFDALAKIKKQAVLDGEIVVYENGMPSFQAIQNYKSRTNAPIQYQVFDILELNGKDLKKKTVVERKQILKDFLPESDVVKYCDHFEGEGKILFEHVAKVGIEGIIAKKATSIYQVGKRTKDWLKIKNVLTDDFVIVGWTDPQNSRSHFGALMLARKEKGKLIYAGTVGTGFDQKTLKSLFDKLKVKARTTSPMSVPFKIERGMHFVEPFYIAQIQYQEMTNDGHVRHPSFLGLRHDK